MFLPGAQQPLPLASLSEHQVAALLRGIGLGNLEAEHAD